MAITREFKASTVTTSNHTENYDLPIWEGEDVTSWMTQVNDAMNKIDDGIYDAKSEAAKVVGMAADAVKVANDAKTHVDETVVEVSKYDARITAVEGLTAEHTGDITALNKRADQADAEIHSLEATQKKTNEDLATLADTVKTNKEDCDNQISETNAAVSTLSEAVSANKADIDGKMVIVNKALDTLTENVGKNKAAIEKNTEDIKGNTAYIEKVEDDLDILSTAVSTINQTVGQHTTKISTLEGEVTALEDNVDANTKAIAETNKAVTSIDDRVTTLEGKVQSIEPALSTATNDIATLKTTTAQHTSSIDTLTENVTSNSSAIDELETHYTDLSGKVDTNTTDIAAAKTDFDSKFGSVNRTLDSHQHEISNLDNTITSNYSYFNKQINTIKSTAATNTSLGMIKAYPMPDSTETGSVNYPLWYSARINTKTSAVDNVSSNFLAMPLLNQCVPISYTPKTLTVNSNEIGYFYPVLGLAIIKAWCKVSQGTYSDGTALGTISFPTIGTYTATMPEAAYGVFFVSGFDTRFLAISNNTVQYYGPTITFSSETACHIWTVFRITPVDLDVQ